MTKSQIKHVQILSLTFQRKLARKYAKGAKEHGGDLHDYPELMLLDQAIEEVIDCYAYLMTLREKLTKKLFKR